MQHIYQPAVPDCLVDNKYHLQPGDFAAFREKHLKIKRKLEVQAVRDNKQAGLMKAILEIDKPMPRREAMKQRSKQLRSTLAAVLKHEAKQEAKRLRAMELAEKKLAEELRRKMLARRVAQGGPFGPIVGTV